MCNKRSYFEVFVCYFFQLDMKHYIWNNKKHIVVILGKSQTVQMSRASPVPDPLPACGRVLRSGQNDEAEESPHLETLHLPEWSSLCWQQVSSPVPFIPADHTSVTSLLLIQNHLNQCRFTPVVPPGRRHLRTPTGCFHSEHVYIISNQFIFFIIFRYINMIYMYYNVHHFDLLAGAYFVLCFSVLMF